MQNKNYFILSKNFIQNQLFCCKFYYQTVKKFQTNHMFFSRKPEQISNRDIQPGQTLFQYLKRKKHIALKQSLQNSFKNEASKQKSFTHVTQNKIQSHATQNKQSARGASTKRRNKKSSHKKKESNISNESCKQNILQLNNKSVNPLYTQKTARRHSFVQDQTNLYTHENINKKNQNRSFISMISPLKNQNHQLSNAKNIEKSSFRQKKVGGKAPQIQTKRIVRQAMIKVQRKYNQKANFESQLRQKLRNFFILLNSALVQLQQNGQSWISDGLDKKLKSIRSNMKIINGFAVNKQIKQQQDLSVLIDTLQLEINKNFDVLEGQIKSQSRHGCQQQIKKINQEYELKINQLTKQKTKLNRQIASLTKANQKMQKQYNKLIERLQSISQQSIKNVQVTQLEQQKLTKSLEAQAKKDRAQNQSLKQKFIILQKKAKDTQYRFEEYKRKSNLQYQQKLSERQSFLLKQIQLLRAQCSKDVNSLNHFHVNKEDKYLNKIKNVEQRLSEQSSIINKLSFALKQTQKLLSFRQQALKQQKVKMEKPLIDLIRMNEELYKHWAALKDIKILLTRLSLYDKFQLIYKDIPFDQMLFFV